MIGNDIVDLQCAAQESNWHRQRYLSKIFTDTEQEFIATAKDQHLAVWTLWSQKESVYKIIAREEQRQFFAPKEITCLALNHASPEQGFVSYQHKTYATSSFFSHTFIHTIAQEEMEENSIKIGIPNQRIGEFDFTAQGFKLKNTQSVDTRFQILSKYALLKNIVLQDLSIHKDALGIPYIYYKNKKQPVTLSLSHHGQYGGYAFK